MHERIQIDLARIADEEGVKVLYAVESGSRAWGFESTDSDWDVRFIYIHPRDWYLTIEPERDVIERPIDSAALDIAGWDVRKALLLFRKGNPPLLEWLSSGHVYLEETSFAARLRAEVAGQFKPANSIHHYLSMAKKNYREYLKRDEVRLKKYFYVLRPLLAAAWTMRHDTAPPMEFAAVLDDFGGDSALRADVDDLLARKRSGGELARGPQRPILNAFIEERIEATEAHVATLGRRELPPRARLDALFRDILDEAWN